MIQDNFDSDTNNYNSDEFSRYRVTVLYIKNNKLFQTDAISCNQRTNLYENETKSNCYNNYDVAGTILSVTVDTTNTSTYEKTSNHVNFDVKYKKV